MCGLKHIDTQHVHRRTYVTPFVGVWIETPLLSKDLFSPEVTPFVGVWIETFCYEIKVEMMSSHPSWVCGLKHLIHALPEDVFVVTPFVGVWIETITTLIFLQLSFSHTLRGCVD